MGEADLSRRSGGMVTLPESRPAGNSRTLALSERFRDLRNRLVADPTFRRWASRFFLTRPFARRQAAALFDLTAGFVYSQILAACVRCDLFEWLAGGPLETNTLAARAGLPREAAEQLLRAAAALKLVEPRSGDRYALGPFGAALVANPGVTAMVRHHDMLYRDLADPLRLLSATGSTELGRFWTYAGGRPAATSPAGEGGARRDHAEYTALMAASQAFVTAEILDAYPLRRHRRLLDLGGGDGSFLIAAGQAAPSLELSLFDLPVVAAIARQKIAAAGLFRRARVSAGNFFHDPLPSGADLVTLVRVLHDHDDASAMAILTAVRRAVAPGGTLLVAEPMAGTPGAEPSGDGYFGFYLMAMGQGRPRTAAEIQAMLEATGFRRCRTVATATPLIARIIVAQPAA